MAKKIEVRQRDCFSNDSYVELWEVLKDKEGTGRYYGRYVYGDEGAWYHISDPLGYCEMDHQIDDDVTFVICDQDGNPLFENSNADSPFPTFSKTLQAKWEEMQGRLSSRESDELTDTLKQCFRTRTGLSLNQWLLTFKNPSQYKQEIDAMFGYDENWCMHYVETGYKVVPDSCFTYLGNKYQLLVVKHRHEVCGAEWKTVVCVDDPYILNDTWNKARPLKAYAVFGTVFDEEHVGPMYDRSTATKLLWNKMQKLFSLSESQHSANARILWIDERRYCEEIDLASLARRIAERDLNRDTIRKILHDLPLWVDVRMFRITNQNKQKIKQKYPGIYGYGQCLI